MSNYFYFIKIFLKYFKILGILIIFIKEFIFFIALALYEKFYFLLKILELFDF